MEQFGAQIIMVLTIVGGVMAIIQFIKAAGKEEKNNAVEIANLKKDIQAQQTANSTLRDETRGEIRHVQKDIQEIKSNQEKMRDIQSAMSGDVKSILSLLNKKQ